MEGAFDLRDDARGDFLEVGGLADLVDYGTQDSLGIVMLAEEAAVESIEPGSSLAMAAGMLRRPAAHKARRAGP